MRQKQKHKQNHTDESSVSPTKANFPTVQWDYLGLKDVAASDGQKALSMYAKSFGYCTFKVVETNGATDTFAVMW